MKLTLETTASPITLPLSAAAPIPFTPDRYKGAETAPVYMIRVPTFRSRAALERASLPIQLRIPSDAKMNEAAIAAAKALVKADEQARCLEILENYAALLDDPGRMGDETDARDALVRDARAIHQQLAPAWPPLTEMIADRLAALATLRYTTARYHVAGWSNVTLNGQPLAFKASADGLVSDDVLQFVPPADISAIAEFAMALLAPDAVTQKN